MQPVTPTSMFTTSRKTWSVRICIPITVTFGSFLHKRDPDAFLNPRQRVKKGISSPSCTSRDHAVFMDTRRNGTFVSKTSLHRPRSDSSLLRYPTRGGADSLKDSICAHYKRRHSRYQDAAQRLDISRRPSRFICTSLIRQPTYLTLSFTVYFWAAV